MARSEEEEKLVTVLEKAIIFGEESLSPEERRTWDVGMEFPQIRSAYMMVKASAKASRLFIFLVSARKLTVSCLIAISCII